MTSLGIFQPQTYLHVIPSSRGRRGRHQGSSGVDERTDDCGEGSEPPARGRLGGRGREKQQRILRHAALELRDEQSQRELPTIGEAGGGAAAAVWGSQPLHSQLLHDLSCKIPISRRKIKLLRMTNSRRATQHLNLLQICDARLASFPFSILPLLHHKFVFSITNLCNS